MSLPSNLVDAFKWQRQQIRYRATLAAATALAKARDDVAKGVKRYPSTSGGNVSRQPDRPNYAFIENPAAIGLRLVGFADEIAGRSVSHKGWYIDAFQDEVYRGVVYQFPARNGKAAYIAAYADPHNYGAIFTDLDLMYGDKIDSSYDAKADARDAAMRADSIAECEAEKEREYSEAWQAGNMFSDCADEIETAKAELRDILKERRAAKGVKGLPHLCKAIDDKARDLIETMQETREKMRKLVNGEGSGRECFGSFYSGDKTMQAAFCDGASLSAFPNL